MRPMSTLALQIPEPAAAKVRGWWNTLEAALGLRGVKRVPFPHLTLFGFEGIDHPRVQRILESACEVHGPVEVRGVGLGLFLTPAPVVYLPVIRTPQLDALHRALWEALGHLGGHRFRLYGPDHWIPHMTLAQFDLGPQQALDAIGLLREQEPDLACACSHLTLFDWIGPLYEPRERYRLQGLQAVASEATL